MGLNAFPRKTRRAFLLWTSLLVTLVAVAVLGAWFLQATIPRHIVLATGHKDDISHQLFPRYKEILAHSGVTLEERLTNGAGENVRLVHDPASGVDVAFTQGGVVGEAERGNLVMIAALYYKPLWIFYRGPETLTGLDELQYKRVAIGAAGSGTWAFAEPLFAANNLSSVNTDLVRLDNIAALRALQAGQVDAALLIGPVQMPAVWQALHDSDLKLMSLEHVDAYPRRFPYIKNLILPARTIDFTRHIPEPDVKLIGTKGMLVARNDLSPAIIELLLDAARELHGEQGYFEAHDQFPNTGEVDVPVSAEAEQHLRFGPSLLHRYLPFSLATYVERVIILLVPLLVIVVPIFNFLPKVLAWRVHSRVYRLYGELALLERDVGARTGTLPIEKWLADLERIEQAAARTRVPASFASQAYTLREHIGLVRRAIMTKAQSIKPGLAASE